MGVLPAVFVWKSVQSDGSLSTGTFEETFHGVVPPQVMILLHAAICWLEVGVTTLEVGKHWKWSFYFPSFETQLEDWNYLHHALNHDYQLKYHH